MTTIDFGGMPRIPAIIVARALTLCRCVYAKVGGAASLHLLYDEKARQYDLATSPCRRVVGRIGVLPASTEQAASSVAKMTINLGHIEQRHFSVMCDVNGFRIPPEYVIRKILNKTGEECDLSDCITLRDEQFYNLLLTPDEQCDLQSRYATQIENEWWPELRQCLQ